MPALMDPLPFSPVEPVTEVLHGVPVTDPYRWLEDQESPRTRAWISEQTRYARSYLDSILGRERIRERVRELLDVETYDSLQNVGSRYFFRKRNVGQEQFCICMREGFYGSDEVLVDPALRGTGPHTAVKPLRISPDGRLMLYEIKQGGERTGTFEFLDIVNRRTLADMLPHGYLRGFAFSPDSRSFCYVHELAYPEQEHKRAVCLHDLGTDLDSDQQIFVASDCEKLRLGIIPGKDGLLGILSCQVSEELNTDFDLYSWNNGGAPWPLIKCAAYKFGPLSITRNRILALTDRGAPNLRVVEIDPRARLQPEFRDVVPTTDVPIQQVALTADRLFVFYTRRTQTEIVIFDHFGRRVGNLPVDGADTVRLLWSSADEREFFVEKESFTKPIQVRRCATPDGETTVWGERRIPFEAAEFGHTQVQFKAKDGTSVPMFLVGRHEVLQGGPHPAIMTSYGGYGVPMTPQFSVFVAFLMERGCLFALPNIRGGSEFGTEWHHSAKRRKRQVAFDDFISAAEWLIETRRTEPKSLAIFGGSNSGLLVGAALTQRPELFRAVVCMVPLLDMLRYHLFDNAHVWRDEFGTADDPEDFKSLLDYSPYHRVRDGVPYPATMLVSGDVDQNCNPLHARKMTARLQAASTSNLPVFLDYSRHRGHSPVLPLSERIRALTDRMAFLCDQLQLCF